MKISFDYARSTPHPLLAVSTAEPLSQECRLSGILHVISRIPGSGRLLGWCECVLSARCYWPGFSTNREQPIGFPTSATSLAARSSTTTPLSGDGIGVHREKVCNFQPPQMCNFQPPLTPWVRHLVAVVVVWHRDRSSQ